MAAETGTIITILSALLAAVGGKEAWSYYKKRLEIKTKLKMHEDKSEAELRDEIRDLLEGQINELKEQIKLLTTFFVICFYIY